MDWTQLTIDILAALKTIGGSWGMAIILLTIIVRLFLIPLSISQQRSMKKMQELGPKLKQLQTKYKHDPQKQQQKMMEFYKENNFNPLGGCLPLLLQMPIFILLYTSLISVPFLQSAGNSSFLFINRLDGTLQGYSGQMDDGVFNVQEKDKFITGKNIIIKIGEKELNAKIDDYINAITYEPTPIVPGEPLTLSIALDKIKLPEGINNNEEITEAIIPVVDDSTKEIEHLTFTLNPKTDKLSSTVKTHLGKSKIHFDIVLLLILFYITMSASQKIMTNMSSATALDPQQKAMQESMTKMMPIMIMAMFVIMPIPAGVLLYMVVSNIFQVGQTVAINKYIDHQNKTTTMLGTAPMIQETLSETENDEVTEEDIEEETEEEITETINITQQTRTNPQQSRKARKKKKRGKKFN